MFWFILIFLIVLFFLWGHSENKKQVVVNEDLKQKGYDSNLAISTETYVAGHPNINNRKSATVIFRSKENLEIFAYPMVERSGIPSKLAVIPCNGVKNIVIEDQTTIEKRISATRLLLAGPFALAWKKAKKNELAILIIEWNDGRFDHETMFEFTGASAMSKANSSRNYLINHLNKSSR